MNRIEDYLREASSAETPQRLLESIAKLFEGMLPQEDFLLDVQLNVTLPSICSLTDEERKSIELMLERRKQGDPVAIIGTNLLLFRVTMVQLSGFLNSQPHTGS